MGRPFKEAAYRSMARWVAIPADMRPLVQLYHERAFYQDMRKQINQRIGLVLGNQRYQYAWAQRLTDIEQAHILAPLLNNVLDVEAPDGTVIKVDISIMSMIKKIEDDYTKTLDTTIRKSEWFKEVASPAALGLGIGGSIAAGLLATVAHPEFYPSVGHLFSYAGLAGSHDNGLGTPAQSKTLGKGDNAHRYSQKLLTILHLLTDQWNRSGAGKVDEDGNLISPPWPWRMKWEQAKVACENQHPDWPKGRIHAKGRRIVQREFLHALYDIWRDWSGPLPPNAVELLRLSTDPKAPELPEVRELWAEGA